MVIGAVVVKDVVPYTVVAGVPAKVAKRSDELFAVEKKAVFGKDIMMFDIFYLVTIY